MKNTITLLITFLITITCFAQQGINYKAIVKDTNGDVLASENMTVQFSIHQITTTGTIVYQEDHNYTTNTNGLVILTIGTDATPSIGTFATIDWSSDLHFLQTTITYSGGTVNFDATQFMAVPYANHAQTAAIADNVFSGDYNDLTNQPTTIPTGLEKITDSINSETNLPIYGWRLVGTEPENYGNIGKDAVDLSYSPVNSSLRGATGIYSTAMGYRSIASGAVSTAMGYSTTASGDYSTAMGNSTSAPSFAETAIGSYNTDYTPNSTSASSANDRLFVIGNGVNNSNRNDALTVLKNGNTGINTSNPESLFEIVHANELPTPSDKTNAFSIKNSNSNNSFQLATHNNGSLTLYSNGNYLGYFNNSSGVYTVISDRRMKKDITPLENGTLNKVMQLNPVSYLMKDQTDTHRNLGLISQEVQELFPSLTHYVKESDLLTLSYTELIPILIKALQEQQQIIDGQQITIEAQKAKDNVHDKSIETLVARLNLLESKSSH